MSTEKFVTRYPLPTPYEREVLTILIEECAEIQHRATKLLRFGRDEIQPGQPKTNAERLSEEVGDFLAILDRAMDAKLADPNIATNRVDEKEAKLKKYMQTEPPDPIAQAYMARDGMNADEGAEMAASIRNILSGE